MVTNALHIVPIVQYNLTFAWQGYFFLQWAMSVALFVFSGVFFGFSALPQVIHTHTIT